MSETINVLGEEFEIEQVPLTPEDISRLKTVATGVGFGLTVASGLLLVPGIVPATAVGTVGLTIYALSLTNTAGQIYLTHMDGNGNYFNSDGSVNQYALEQFINVIGAGIAVRVGLGTVLKIPKYQSSVEFWERAGAIHSLVSDGSSCAGYDLGENGVRH